MSPPLLRRPIGRFGLVLSLTLIGGCAGLTYGVTVPPEYTARAYVVTTGDAAVTYARAYRQVATSGPVLERAATLLGADPSGLEKVTASTSSTAPAIEIAARSRSAARAATVANAAASALAAYGTEREPALHAGLAVLAPATVPTRPSSPSLPCELMIGTSAGLLAGAVAALFTLRRPHPARPDFEDPAEIEGHLRIWRAQYGPRSVTAYRGAAALTEPPDRPASPKPALDGPGSAEPAGEQPGSAGA
jgi:capsular polysaccharide biosynthesis protein